jgi:hypothetical protein
MSTGKKICQERFLVFATTVWGMSADVQSRLLEMAGWSSGPSDLG